MDHKEKCKRLKSIRKKVADVIGVDLHQTECTFEGDCSGTCPKCKKEEQVLNKAIMGGAAMATAVMLSACGMQEESSGSQSTETSADFFGIIKENIYGGYDVPLDGDVVRLPDDNNQIEGDVERVPDEVNQIDGDIDSVEGIGTDNPNCYEDDDQELIVLEGDVEYVPEVDFYDEDFVLQICKNYSGAPHVEIDHYEGNCMVVHCYEVVENEGESHTSTIDWIYVDPVNNIMTNFQGDQINYKDYL